MPANSEPLGQVQLVLTLHEIQQFCSSQLSKSQVYGGINEIKALYCVMKELITFPPQGRAGCPVYMCLVIHYYDLTEGRVMFFPIHGYIYYDNKNACICRFLICACVALTTTDFD